MRLGLSMKVIRPPLSVLAFALWLGGSICAVRSGEAAKPASHAV